MRPLVERSEAVVGKAEADERAVPLAQQLESMQTALAAAEAKVAEQREEPGGKTATLQAMGGRLQKPVAMLFRSRM
jgi:hypothetical protein